MSYSFEVKEEDGVHIGDDAKSAKDEFKSKTSNGISVSMITKPGVYTFRIWPDRNEHGRIVLIRKEWLHVRQLDDNNKLMCTYDTRVERLLDEAKSQGWEDAWKLEAREFHFAMVRMYELGGEASEDKKWHTAGEDYALMLQSWQAFRINEFLESLTPSERLQLINPQEKAPAIQFSMVKDTREGKGNYHQATVGVTKQLHEMGEMKLPEGVVWKGLNSIYVESGKKCSDEMYANLQKFIASKVNRIGSFVDPGRAAPEDRGAGTPADNKVRESNAGVEVVSADSPRGPQVETTEAETRNDNPISTEDNEKCSHPDKGDTINFGKPPETPAPACIRCAVQIECMQIAGLV